MLPTIKVSSSEATHCAVLQDNFESLGLRRKEFSMATSGAAKKTSCARGVVSDWLRERTELCMYVEQLDIQRDRDPAFTCDSYRKLKWLRNKQRQRLGQEINNKGANDGSDHGDGDDQECQDAVVQSAYRQDDGDDTEDIPEPSIDSNDPFEILVGDILRGHDVTVTCTGDLPVYASDPLGALSIPCIREGNSLTLCSSPAIGDQLVVFGGRVLRDTSVLLPRAIRIDPLKLERAKYTYSNGVYSFNIATSTWALRECSGRVPRERSDHSALFLAPRYLLIFGGRGRNDQVFRDFFALSLDNWHWTQIDTAATPYERYWHGWCIAFDAEQEWQPEPSIFLFGGKSDALIYDEFHQLQTGRLQRLLADVQRDQSEGSEVAVQPYGLRRDSDPEQIQMERNRRRLPTWFVPQAVGKPPSARFGMQVVALENEQLAVLGGWRAPNGETYSTNSTRKNRLLDLHILDLTTLVWSTPQLSTLVTTQPHVPSERLLFECFYENHMIMLFGGHTYAFDGETESFSACEDATTVLYKLDVGRMIWRRQSFGASETSEAGEDNASIPAIALPVAHSHHSSNAMLYGRGFTCSSESHSLQLQLTALDIRAPKRKHTTV